LPFERSVFRAIEFQKSENVGSLDTKDILNIENRVIIVLYIMKGIKTGSKYYVFNIGVENRVKIFREKTQENLGMKTWIHHNYQKTPQQLSSQFLGSFRSSLLINKN
jgi:hypothetical protein